MGSGAGRVYGFGEPAGCMGSGGSQGVWVREVGRVYGFGSRQGVLVRGVGIQVGMGHSILMTGVLLRTSQSGAGCGDSGGDGAFYSDDWSAFTHLTEHA